MPDNEIACAVKDIHRLYCQLTGQQLTLRYDRERLWFEFLRAGFAPHQLQACRALSAKGNPCRSP